MIVHCKRDRALVAAAEAEGRYVYIGRPSPFGNPFVIPSRDYDREADPLGILKRYEQYVRENPRLMAMLPGLRGKVLGCWCAPLRCHGDVLLKLVAELPEGA